MNSLHQWAAATGKTSLTVLALLFVLTACSRSDSGTAAGAASGSQTSSSSSQTSTPETAPAAQPRFNEVGNGTVSRIATNAAGQRGLSVDETKPPGSSAGSSPDADPDSALARKVRVAISTGTTGTTGTYSDDMLVDIGVRASHGTVTLTGNVGSQSAKEALGARAKAVEGVGEVRNELQISPGAHTPRPGAPSGRGQTDRVPQNSARQD